MEGYAADLPVHMSNPVPAAAAVPILITGLLGGLRQLSLKAFSCGSSTVSVFTSPDQLCSRHQKHSQTRRNYRSVVYD